MHRLESLPFDNSFLRLSPTLYSEVAPQGFAAPHLVSVNPAVAGLLDLDPAEAQRPEFVAFFSGQQILPGSQPLAMKYTGHQFGGYNPELGDGRGLLLGEVVNHRKERWDLHLKGAGRTPYSRFGDGRAVLRSSIREYLGGEAMHGLGIPTTRALCIIGSDEGVRREQIESAAMIVRVADSHIRFGHFEWLAHSGQIDLLKTLCDYVIDRHFPACRETPKPYESLFAEVVRRTAQLMASWQLVGFAHGVMNTDNFSITGSTFDFGPFAFLDAYDPGLICNHSDDQGRYAWNRQPTIGLWNLNALAHAFSPLIDHAALVEILQGYEAILLETYDADMVRKLGLMRLEPGDHQLIMDFLALLQQNGTDYTRSFRALSRYSTNQPTSPLRDDFLDREAFDAWLNRYRERLLAANVADDVRQATMLAANPKYILRNYMAQVAIDKANAGDFSEIDTLLRLLQHPFDEQPEFERYASPPPDWGRHMAISCSS